MAGYIGAQGQIRSGLSATIDELNIIDGVTSTTAELNILDGVTSTAAELNILDGVTATAAEINLIDGGTARGTTAVADGDGFLTNDGGTMRMTKVDTLATYMGTKITGGSMVYLASTGAISSGTASVSFTQFDASKYDYYKFSLLNVKPTADGGVHVYGQVSTDGGSNYDSTNGNYHWATTDDLTGLMVAYNVGHDTGEACAGEWNLMAPHLTGYTYGVGNIVVLNFNASLQGGSHSNYSYAVHLVEADVDAIKFVWSSGNFASGEMVMYGIVNGT